MKRPKLRFAVRNFMISDLNGIQAAFRSNDHEIMEAELCIGVVLNPNGILPYSEGSHKVLRRTLENLFSDSGDGLYRFSKPFILPKSNPCPQKPVKSDVCP